MAYRRKIPNARLRTKSAARTPRPIKKPLEKSDTNLATFGRRPDV
jgi:hypothetical protein